MFKFNEEKDLEKAGKSIGRFFEKQVQELEARLSLHAAVAVHYAAIAKAYADHADSMKAEIDVMKTVVAAWDGPKVSDVVTDSGPVN
jgi:phage host-nuclease inhibitor protein Gam